MKQTNSILFYVLSLLCSLNAQAQQRSCGTMENLQLLLQQDEHLAERMTQIEQFTQQWTAQHPNGSGSRAVYTIPVVVHIVYNNAAENISDAQVLSQIEVLNKDFSRTNADAVNTPSVWQSIAANTEIQFCLATRDANGSVTTGITRTFTSSASFTSDNKVKSASTGGEDAWPAGSYLNIWVCDLGGIIGYAQFPGGAATTDGVVVDYKAFGTTGSASVPFHLGRTATHEIGHWLNLKHIWGDESACTGSDWVGDTPNHADENFGCPSFPLISCNNGPNGDMFMNYMDYSNDICMNLFTSGQRSRMRALFATNGARNSLLSSNGCATTLEPVILCNVPTGLYASNITPATTTLNWSMVSSATAYSVRFKATASSLWVTGSATTNTWNISGLAQGTQYEFQVKTICSATSSAYSASAFFATATSGCTDAYEPNESRTAAPRLPSSLVVQAQIASAADADWYRFGNSSSKRNIRISLTNLPANYNVALYSSRGTLLRQSVNTGVGNEAITYNNAALGTYYARVYGYNGAYNASQCYSLSVQLSSSAFRMEAEQALTDSSESNSIVRLYPNPATEFLVAEFTNPVSSSMRFRVVDVNGKTVLNEDHMEKHGTELFIQTSTLPSGVYLLHIQDGSLLIARRFVTGNR